LSKILSEYEPLDANKIKEIIGLKQQASLAKLEIFDSIDSTNTYLLQQVKQHGISGWVCFAEEQTAGRGRRGRTWFSPQGANIYCSILWDFSQQNVSNLGVATAVIIANVLQKYGVSSGIQLKWPNDVLFEGRKLGGILLERTGSFVVIGIGINLFLPPEMDTELAARAIDLAAITQQKIARNKLAGLLINELLMMLPIFAEQGLSAFLQEWRKYDALINQQILVHAAEKVFMGKMCGINNKGELLLLDPQNNLHAFCYGEVTVRAVS
jgi:BirA family biotin operon repressor/biotin-[acetyl-CoA-carboxylase] ligase